MNTYPFHAVESLSDQLVSAEDYDSTNILVGVDSYASSYWWMPGFYDAWENVETLEKQKSAQATHRTGSRPPERSRSTSAANAA